jgi:hypothetical protein
MKIISRWRYVRATTKWMKAELFWREGLGFKVTLESLAQVLRNVFVGKKTPGF